VGRKILGEMAPKHYRSDIQGLRALAVLAVIANHFSNSLFPNGFLGVDIFFVISGYVITGLLERSKESGFNNFIRKFYARRLVRLLPALILCVVVTEVLIALFIGPSRLAFYDLSWRTGLSSLFGLSNLYLLRLSFDYFAVAAELNPFTHTWSLGVEEQFYLIYPIFFWIMVRFFSEGRKALTTLLFIASAFAMIFFIVLSARHPVWAFYFMPARFWELGTGCLAFYMAGTLVSIPRAKAFFPYGLLLLVSVVYILRIETIWLNPIVVIITAWLLAIPSPLSFSSRILGSKPLQIMGDISYPLYLWHWSVLSLSRWTVGVDVWTAPLQVLLMLSLAFATHQFVELPIRKIARFSSDVTPIRVGLMSVLAVATLIVVLNLPLKGFFYLGTEPNMENQIAGSLEPEDLDFKKAQDVVSFASLQCNLTPDFLPGAEYRQRPLLTDKLFSDCMAGNSSKIILVGDSFSTTLGQQVALEAIRMGFEYKSIFGFGCPIPLTPTGKFAKPLICNLDIPMLQRNILANVNAGDIVVLRVYFSAPPYLDFNSENIAENSSELLSAFDATIVDFAKKIEARRASLLVLGSNTVFEFSPVCQTEEWFNERQMIRCKDGFMIDDSFENKFAVLQDQHFKGVVNNISSRVKYFSVIDRLCDKAAGRCKSYANGSILYKDRSHLNSVAVGLMSGDLNIVLRSIIVGQ
jgi:peptidoglycan/LPS O-acetylase OafA/YrhL